MLCKLHYSAGEEGQLVSIEDAHRRTEAMPTSSRKVSYTACSSRVRNLGFDLLFDD